MTRTQTFGWLLSVAMAAAAAPAAQASTFTLGCKPELGNPGGRRHPPIYTVSNPLTYVVHDVIPAPPIPTKPPFDVPLKARPGGDVLNSPTVPVTAVIRITGSRLHASPTTPVRLQPMDGALAAPLPPGMSAPIAPRPADARGPCTATATW